MALCVNEDGRFFDARILSYIEEGKSTVVKKMLEASGKFCDLVDSYGATLLHYAARFGNANVLQYLIDSGSDVNAQKNNGNTPLILAMESGHRKTIVKLLKANARIDIKNNFGVDALILVFRLLFLSKVKIRNVPLDHTKIMKRLMLRMKRDCSNDSQSMAKRLLEADCELCYAVYLKNTMVTDIMLKSSAIQSRELASAFYTAIGTADLPNVKLLMEHGAFEACDEVDPMLWYPDSIKDTPEKLEILEILLSRTNFDSAQSQREKFCMFAFCSREFVRILLKYVDIRTEVMLECHGEGTIKCSYLHGLMSNQNADIVNELPVDVNFDFDKLDSRGASCLARAVRICNLSTVEFLLGKGVQVNSVNDYGCNALMMVIPSNPNPSPSQQKNMLKMINILLKYGVDVQLTDRIKSETVFDHAIPENKSPLLKPIVAHLAMLESLSKPIIQLIYDKIESHPMCKSHFKLCKLRLERMKRITIHKSVTLYKLLTESDEKVMLYVQNHEFPDRFNRLMRGRRRSNAYYDFLLRRRTFECIRAARLKREAGVALTGILQIDNHTVTNHVLGYLSVDDWKSLQDVH